MSNEARKSSRTARPSRGGSRICAGYCGRHLGTYFEAHGKTSVATLQEIIGDDAYPSEDVARSMASYGRLQAETIRAAATRGRVRAPNYVMPVSDKITSLLTVGNSAHLPRRQGVRRGGRNRQGLRTARKEANDVLGQALGHREPTLGECNGRGAGGFPVRFEGVVETGGGGGQTAFCRSTRGR